MSQTNTVLQLGVIPGCLVDLIEEITTSVDRGEFAITILIFLDLTKHFDTVIPCCPSFQFGPFRYQQLGTHVV